MTYQNNDIQQAIMQIQELLRTIQIAGKKVTNVPIDGIYGDTTKLAVENFQKENGIPKTGIVDKETYDMLYKKGIEAEFELSSPLPLYIFPRGTSVKKGEKSDFVLLLQIILNALTVAYDEFDILELNGNFDEKMEEMIKVFQRINDIEQDGIVNKITWNALVSNFNKFNQNM